MVDFEGFKVNTGLYKNDLKELYIEFAKELKKYQQEVIRCLEDKNYENLSKVMHNIIGISANYRAYQLNELSIRIQETYKKREVDHMEYHLLALNEVMTETIDYMNEYFKIS